MTLEKPVSTEAKPKKRIRRNPETTRGMILDMTEKLMIEEGYAAVSSRRIARELGLNAATVHYYYPVTDDIFIDLHRRMTERQMEKLRTVVEADNPLRTFWEIQADGTQSALGVEFLALANHREAVRKALAEPTDDARKIQAELIERIFVRKDSQFAKLSPLTLATIMVAIGRLLANDARLGITAGHDEVRTNIAPTLDEIMH